MFIVENSIHYALYKNIQQIISDIIFHEYVLILFKGEKDLPADTIEIVSFLIKYNVSY